MLLAGDRGAHDVDVVAGDAQRLQELRASLIRARGLAGVLSHLEETDSGNEARGQRNREPAGAGCGVAHALDASYRRGRLRRLGVRIELCYHPRGEVLA